MLEAVYTNYKGDKILPTSRIWKCTSNGYGSPMVFTIITVQRSLCPVSRRIFLKQAVLGIDASIASLSEGQTAEQLCDELFPVIFDPAIMPKRVNQADGEDLVLTSACNYYDGVTQKEAESFLRCDERPER